LSAAAFKELGDAFMAGQLESMVSEAAQAQSADKAAKLKEWGPDGRGGQRGVPPRDADPGREGRRYQQDPGRLRRRADARPVPQDRPARRRGFLCGNGNGPIERFGVANAADAKKAIDAMTDDKDTAAKLRAKDPVATARYNRLIDALAHYRQLEAQAR
jgi:hypothetical protein